MRSVAIGLLGGLGLAWFATSIFRSVLYGIGTDEPTALLGAATLMLGTATLAAWLPARKATSVEPAGSLKGA
jgi:ABC-type antimicrobial peptide transport system permease subunit